MITAVTTTVKGGSNFYMYVELKDGRLVCGHIDHTPRCSSSTITTDDGKDNLLSTPSLLTPAPQSASDQPPIALNVIEPSYCST